MKRFTMMIVVVALALLGSTAAFAATDENSVILCDNGVDDDGDGKTDCADDGCQIACDALAEVRGDAAKGDAEIYIKKQTAEAKKFKRIAKAIEVACKGNAKLDDAKCKVGSWIELQNTVVYMARELHKGDTDLMLALAMDNDDIVGIEGMDTKPFVEKWAPELGIKTAKAKAPKKVRRTRRTRRQVTATPVPVQQPQTIAAPGGPATAPAVVDCTAVRRAAFKGCVGTVPKIETTTPNFEQCAAEIRAYGRTRCAK